MSISRLAPRPVTLAIADLPAVVSAAVGDLVAGPSRPGRVLGTSEHAVWIAVGDDVVVVTTSDGVRLPNAAMVAATSDQRPFGFVRPDEPVTIGEGRIELRGLAVSVGRWWDPLPGLPPSDAAAIGRRIAQARSRVAPVAIEGLGTALAGRDPGSLRRSVLALVGDGEGLTPVGDDLVGGGLAATRLVGRAVGRTDAVRFVDAVGPGVVAAARGRTTTLSVALLRHAVSGEVAAPAGAMLRALAGRGDLESAVTRLRAIGHSSGDAIAFGILVGAAAALGEGAT